MSSSRVKVQSRGRVTLPAQLRLALELEPGDEVEFVETGAGRYEVRLKAGQSASLQRGSRASLSVKVPERDERQQDLPL